jgi:small GTP-binding protein
MDKEDNIFNQFPEDSQKTIRQIWQAIPEKERSSLTNLIDQLPTKSNLWKLLMKLTGDQAKLTMGRKQRIAIVGPANVGKSTLYNQFIQSGEDKAEVSAVPGTTRENQEATAGLFSIIDTPGADAVGSLGEAERKKALDAAEQADFLIIIFDAIQGVKQTEIELFGTLLALKKPFIVVLNKIDLVRKDIAHIKQNAAQNLRLETNQIITISAKESTNLAVVLTAIASAEPEIVAALGKALPQYRWQLAWRVIVSAASLSGVIALTPLPVIDFIPLVVNQSSMVLGIARIYNYRIDFKRARELVVTFGLAYLGRTLFYELSKLGGIPGWILAAAIAASTTVAMGFAAAQWFERGEKLTGEQLKELTRKVTDMLLNSLKQIRDRKDRKKLQEQIEIILTDSNLGETPDLTEEVDETKDAGIK